MLYDVSMKIEYAYDVAASGARHVVRVLPLTLAAGQRLIAGSLTFSPTPDERSDFIDFFRNPATAVNFRTQHDRLEIRMQARVLVENLSQQVDFSPAISRIGAEVAGCWTLEPEAPHHFLGDSPRLAQSASITEWVSSIALPDMSTREVATAVCRMIHEHFTYLPGATTVDTPAEAAFRLKKGVCQDFAHIMIIALRAIGIPAGYVSGFLRTIPPPGAERLEGADAMHAWVRVWCGRATGWMEWDPTNNMMAGSDHIRVAYGRDYSDVAPVIGILKSYGSHKTEQAVDVIPVKT
ncbi:transglutaminase family protein [Rhizobium sp. KVB221]|uniref:Transglutaminase family protein n=1 Tax=Rhizobium setariae TaxID=2801340 RepID=A0A936YMG4_9HYPH|nr:transglutaminase family protein [Rhizobium setariae]MBL0372213.1 transglutaminase family protein [Rhizobium setariae]